MADGVTIQVNTGPLNRALKRFLSSQGPKLAEKGARKVAADVVRHTTKGLTHGGDGTPRRVDTGRLRAAWRLASKDAGLSVSSLRGGVKGGAGASGQQSDDGTGRTAGKGLEFGVMLSNNVEYALAVEFGTVHMSPGNHLARAVEIVRRAIPGETGRGSIQEAIADSWEDAR